MPNKVPSHNVLFCLITSLLPNQKLFPIIQENQERQQTHLITRNHQTLALLLVKLLKLIIDHQISWYPVCQPTLSAWEIKKYTIPTIPIPDSKPESHCLKIQTKVLYLQYRSDCKAAESIQRTEWTSHHSPSDRLTQPWELTSHHHPASHRLLRYCPLCPLSSSPSRPRVKTLTEALLLSQTDTVELLHTLGSRIPAQMHTATQTHTHSTPTPSLPLPWDPNPVVECN